MTSKERVLTTMARQEPDWVPVNYSANAGIDRRLKAHFGLNQDDTEGLRQALGVPVIIHSCGSSSWAFADFIEMACCRRTLDVMMPGGGYCFAPTHDLQDNSPITNVVAMYATARQYGIY